MVIFTDHAAMKLNQRNISKELVLETLADPDYETLSYGNRRISYKKFKNLYLAVVWKSKNSNSIIITQHWVAKIKK